VPKQGGKLMKWSFVVLGVALMLVSTARAQEAKPKVFVGATVLSQNDQSITIRHSAVAEKKAERLAWDHCQKFHKYAVQTSSKSRHGLADSTTTWACRASELGSN
jgi:hypothetical protein